MSAAGGGGIDTLVELFVSELARRLGTELASTTHSMVSQHGSPLGARRHRAAVKRRLENGQRGAAIVGRRYLLSHDALQCELSALTPAPPKVSNTSDKSGALDQFERELMGGLKNISEVK